MFTKGCPEFFLFCLELELFDLVSTHLQKPGLLITQDLSKIIIIKKPEHPFVHIGKKQTLGNISAKDIKFYGSWSSSKFSIFQINNLVSGK